LKHSMRFVLFNTQATVIGLQASYTRSFGRKVTEARLTQGISPLLTLSRMNPSFGAALGEGPTPGTRVGVSVTYGYDDRLFVWEPVRALSLSASLRYVLTALDNGALLSQGSAGAGWESIFRLSDSHGIAAALSAGITFGDLRIA